ncbi:hypothetical protein [Geotalea sp. SG265]|uniref:NHL domain-containing protein n=1 Tax=Geotalea sp. SG265 TaxID=2922867 RepID=UPI001FAE8CA6|nr:hypothetical protein [Geotalea sp. SG265]
MQQYRRAVMLLISAMVFSGCSGAKTATGPVFFPMAPNPPRVQYLMKVSNSEDIEGKKSSFTLFARKDQKDDQVRHIIKPYGVTTHKGRIFICDTGGGTISIIDPVAKTFLPLKGNFSTGKLRKPVNLAFGNDGTMYVADVERKEVLVYDPEGNFKTAFGKDLEMKPTDVAVDDKFLYVIDMAHSEIKVLDSKSGKLLNQIGKRTETTDGLALPSNLAMDGKGFLYVTNTLSGKVMKFDRDGHLLQSFGKLGDGFGQFGRPKGITVDDAGRIYVADSAHQNVQLFNEKGRLLMFFGDPGSAPGGTMNLPTSVAVSKENLDFYQKMADPSFELENVIFVINQYGSNKLSVYGLGHRKGDELDPATGDIKAKEQQSSADTKK